MTRLMFMTAVLGVCSAAGCAPSGLTPAAAPRPDPRVGLRAGKFDAAQSLWNLRLVSTTPPRPEFTTAMNSDMAFTGRYAIQGNFNGYQVWDISNPAAPTLRKAYVCPASQSDVSVYRNLLFVSGESLTARLDCGTQGVKDSVSKDRLRGLRIFDISDIGNPKYVGNVQTCRGSHTHTVLVDPKDTDNVYTPTPPCSVSKSSRCLSPIRSARQSSVRRASSMISSRRPNTARPPPTSPR